MLGRKAGDLIVRQQTVSASQCTFETQEFTAEDVVREMTFLHKLWHSIINLYPGKPRHDPYSYLDVSPGTEKEDEDHADRRI